jgi:peroxiredoxin family protein
MQQTIKNTGVAPLAELRELSQEAGVKFVVCQMTVELFGFSHDDFVDGMDYVGAASFLPVAREADVTLFI